jgi:hypothetical protein
LITSSPKTSLRFLPERGFSLYSTRRKCGFSAEVIGALSEISYEKNQKD